MDNENQIIKFLDVGHADSSIIYLNGRGQEDKKVIIIDIVNSGKLLKELEKNNIKVVDLVIISHSDEDHCKGVNDFLEKFNLIGIVKKICFNYDRTNVTKTMRYMLKKFCEIYRRQNIVLLSGYNDTSIQKRELVSFGKSRLLLLYPNVAEFTEACLKNSTNNASIVCLLENNVCNILFTGDLEAAGWDRLLKRIPELECDILKMPHHGAFYDEGNIIGLRKILEILKPSNVIISSGANKRYKHPDRRTIQLLNEKNIKVYCTGFTNLCHCNENEFERKCYGNIKVIISDCEYEFKTEVNNLSKLSNIICKR